MITRDLLNNTGRNCIVSLSILKKHIRKQLNEVILKTNLHYINLIFMNLIRIIWFCCFGIIVKQMRSRYKKEIEGFCCHGNSEYKSTSSSSIPHAHKHVPVHPCAGTGSMEQWKELPLSLRGGLKLVSFIQYKNLYHF